MAWIRGGSRTRHLRLRVSVIEGERIVRRVRTALLATLLLVALAPATLAQAPPRLFPQTDTDETLVAHVRQALAFEPAYVLGLVYVSNRETEETDGGVRILLTFQDGTRTTIDQRVRAKDPAGNHHIAPDDLVPGIELHQEYAAVTVVAPPQPEGASPEEKATALARALGLPAEDLAWTEGTHETYRVLAEAAPHVPGFYVDCENCTTLTAHAANLSRGLNEATATFDASGRLVLFRASPWYDLDAADFLSRDEAKRRVERSLVEGGYARGDLRFWQVGFDGTRVDYVFRDFSTSANYSYVRADPTTGAILGIMGREMPTQVAPGSPGGSDARAGSGSNDTPAPLAGLVVLAVVAGALLRPNERR